MGTTGSSEILYPSTKLQSVTSQKTVISKVIFSSLCPFGNDVRCMHFASSHKALLQPVEFLYAVILYFCIRPIYNSLTDSCVSTVINYRTTDESEFGFRREKKYFSLYRVHTDLDTIQALVVPSSGVKRPRYQANHFCPLAQVKNARSYAYFFRASWFAKYWGDCTFPFVLRKHSSLLMCCVELVAVPDI